MVKLGDRAKDVITGFTGIVVGYTEWLYGCRRFGLTPEKPDKDGKPIETQWFDEGQVKVLKVAAIKPPKKPAPTTGGPSRGEERK